MSSNLGGGGVTSDRRKEAGVQNFARVVCVVCVVFKRELLLVTMTEVFT